MFRQRRNRVVYVSSIMLIIWCIAWVFLSVALADTKTAIEEKVEWKLIAWLVGLVQLLGSGFLIYVVQDIKKSIRKLFQLQEKVLTHDVHKEIDHSQYCPVCRK
jgi:hypothetical protein